MNELWREIKKHWLIYRLFLKNSLMAQMEYRFNFIGNLAMESGYLLVKLSYVVVVYRSGVSIHGLSPDEILLFIGTFVFLTAVYAGLYMINNFGLRGKIKDGDLDLILTKPVSLQFMATLRQADLTIFSVDALAGAVMVCIAWARLSIPVNLVTVGGYLGFLGISSVVSYCLFLLPQILSFWLMNTSAIAEITDSFWDFNNMPMDIYNRWIQQIGVFILPIFVVTNFPPMFVLKKMPSVYLGWALLLPFLLLGLVRLAWKRGLRNYSSASS
ncbi:ABC transporter permease [Anaerolinea thermolimosa]|uniref:ABC transporter permease n=1 Tax=Anaerolinea thermolimosa TaxID=229919 RepID=UPI000785F376|nr:ABC-2 family transporter protein [Anaerolinea thermolimosa]